MRLAIRLRRVVGSPRLDSTEADAIRWCVEASSSESSWVRPIESGNRVSSF